MNPTLIRCRAAACRRLEGETDAWSFFLLNDSAVPLDSVVLESIVYSWGDYGSSETAEVQVDRLSPGAAVQVWQDDGSGVELQMDLLFRVRAAGREVQLRFEFPKLYRLRSLPVVPGLGRRGFAVATEA